MERTSRSEPRVIGIDDWAWRKGQRYGTLICDLERRRVIDQVAAQITTEVPTSTLNKVLHGCFERVQPPMVQGRRMKFYYATQTGTKPVRFRLFVNDTVKLTEAYRLFLINQLRQSFGLEGAPVVLDFKTSHGTKK